jgi:hypothetical protein
MESFAPADLMDQIAANADLVQSLDLTLLLLINADRPHETGGRIG